ncbi:hypothetical protein JHK82_027699 [Glycine max]|nr:hypothetical protein JHK82_027699 [Glycine max]
MAAKSKILVLGGTSYIGKFIVMASVEAGHPTFALVRESTLSHPEKSKLIQSFKSFGVTLLYAIKQVDVLIFMLGGQQIDDQVNVIAIKEAGNIKAMTTLVELGSTAKDIISFIPQYYDGNLKVLLDGHKYFL